MVYMFTCSRGDRWRGPKGIDRVHGTRQDPLEAKARHVNLTGAKNQVLVTLVFDDDGVAASVKARP
jgi:hypothetical protein